MNGTTSNPVAIITGAASGIGLAVATHMYSLNYKVVIADLNVPAGEMAAASLGPNALFVQTDVSSYPSQARLFKRAYEWGGERLDFCHANAGIEDRQVIYDTNEEVDEEGLLKPLNTKTMNVNLEAVMQGLWLFKYYNRRSKKEGKGGKFVITSSAAGLYGDMPTNPQYASSKYGLVGLTRSAGPGFLKSDNITVNCICPAFIVTNLCPPHVLAKWPKEHITPLSTATKAIDAFLDDDKLTGQAVELSLDQIYFRKMLDYPNESQRWIGEESGAFWEEAYQSVPERKGGVKG